MTRQTRAFAGLLAAAMLSAAGPAMSQAIKVGRTRGGSCEFSTIGAAFTEAQRRWNNGQGRQEIHITRDTVGGLWSSVNITIADMDVNVVGGFADCETDDIDDTTTLSGAGGAARPVFTITGQADVRLESLDISDGDPASPTEGGGIDFRGRGGLHLVNTFLTGNLGGQGGAIRFEAVNGPARLDLVTNVVLQDNFALSGGGIYFAGNGGQASLHTGNDVLIGSNKATAGDGGGIAARGHVSLELFGPRSRLSRNTATGNGGGLDLQGFGDASLEGFVVERNSAGYGGGLNFVGTGLLAATLDDDVTLDTNSARNDGGGIHLQGSVLFEAYGKNNSVILNQAGGNGGGLALDGPVYAVIGAAGPWPGKAVFHYNSAQRGGAIATKGGEDENDDGSLYLFTGYADHPMTLSENVASQDGGAVYGIGKAGGGEVKLCIQNTSMYANRAVRGAAVYADTDNEEGREGQSAHLEFNMTDLCDFPQEAVPCEGPLCNQITFNRAEASNTTPAGAVFETGQVRYCEDRAPCDADPWVDQYFMRDLVVRNNVADALIKARTPLWIQNIAAYENELAAATLDGNVRMLHGSFAGNSGEYALNLVDGWARSSVFLLPVRQKLMNAAVRQGAVATHVISNDFTGVPPDPSNYLSADPGFVNAQTPGFDLHLRADAMVIDTAPEPANLPTDIERKARTVDVLRRADQYGPADRGAYEFQDAGTPPDPDPDPDPKPELLRDGFEQRVN